MGKKITAPTPTSIAPMALPPCCCCTATAPIRRDQRHDRADNQTDRGIQRSHHFRTRHDTNTFEHHHPPPVIVCCEPRGRGDYTHLASGSITSFSLVPRASRHSSVASTSQCEAAERRDDLMEKLAQEAEWRLTQIA